MRVQASKITGHFWDVFARQGHRTEEIFEDVSGLPVSQNLTRGVVALVFRCTPIAGEPTATDESQRVQWLTPDEVRSRMTPAYAVRVLDAFNGGTASRAHDGVHLIIR